jgi:hypothetical protein
MVDLNTIIIILRSNIMKPNRERAGGDTDDDGSDNPLFLREAEALPLVRKPDFQASYEKSTPRYYDRSLPACIRDDA